MADSVDAGIKHDCTSDELLDPSCDPCKNEKKHLKVVSFCPTCVEYFCQDCDRAHANFQLTKNHRLKHGSEMPSCEEDKPPKFQDCQIHANSIRDWFCIDHNAMICSKCRDQHDKCFIRHAYDMSKILRPNHIHKFAYDISEAKDIASTLISGLEEMVSKLEISKTRMLEKAEIQYKEMKSELERKFYVSCEAINNTCTGHISSLTAKISSIADETEQYDSVLDSINRERKSRLDTKLFVKMQTLVENTTESVKTVHKFTKGMKSIDLEYIVDETWKQFLLNDSKIGFVQETMSENSFNAALPYISFPPNSDDLFQEMNFINIHTPIKLVIGAVAIGRLSSCSLAFISDKKHNVFKLSSCVWPTKYGPKIKIPTNVLISPDSETLVAFGYEAEVKYAELFETGQNVDYYYFENCWKDLEQILLKTQIGDETIKDETGKSMSFFCVFNFVIRYLTDALMGTLKTANRYLRPEDITLAVVVPSLSTDNAKDFVKEAVITTGFPSENVTIIPEAQAVSEFCHSTLEAGKTEHHQHMVAHGEDYMMVNLRDNNMEVSINKYAKSLPEKLLLAQFTDVGESAVNKAFNDFLQDVVGRDVFQAYAKAMPDDLEYIREVFERKKVVLDTQRRSSITFFLDSGLFDTYEVMNGQSLEEAIQQSKYSGDVKITGDKLSVKSHLVRQFFDAPVIRCYMLLKHLLQSRYCDKTKCIFMTGNLSKLCEFQRAIKSAFPNVNLFFPEDPDFAAVNGAVIRAYGSKLLLS